MTSKTENGTYTSYQYDNSDQLTRDGAANAQNQYTTIDSDTPTYNNGSLTADTSWQYFYDAWNRLAAVTDEFDTVIKSYLYDGLNRRVAETVDVVTTQLVYSANWQVLEERIEDEATTRYIWSPVYVDAMILRDRATTTPGTFDERLYIVQDANFNVVALVSTSGEVVQRYAYDPYGVATVMNEDYTTTSLTDYSWIYLHQGGRLDIVSGNYYFRNRDFSPTLGRWTSVDPIRFAAGDVNLYRTENNNPVLLLDPTGMWSRKGAGYGASMGLGIGLVGGTIVSPGLGTAIGGCIGYLFGYGLGGVEFPTDSGRAVKVF